MHSKIRKNCVHVHAWSAEVAHGLMVKAQCYSQGWGQGQGQGIWMFHSPQNLKLLRTTSHTHTHTHTHTQFCLSFVLLFSVSGFPIASSRNVIIVFHKLFGEKSRIQALLQHTRIHKVHYIPLPWLYFTLLDSTLLYHGSTSLYWTLHYSCSTSLYQTLYYPTMTLLHFILLYNVSISDYITPPWLYFTLYQSTMTLLDST